MLSMQPLNSLHIPRLFLHSQYFENVLQEYACTGVGWGYTQSVFFSTGVGGGFKNSRFGAYVLYGWPLSIKVFFLFRFDDANTNFCQFQYFFKKLIVKLQIQSIKEIRVLQGVRLPLLSLITRASQFVNINYYGSKLKSLQKNIDTHELYQVSIRFNTPMFKGCWGMLSDSEH